MERFAILSMPGPMNWSFLLLFPVVFSSAGRWYIVSPSLGVLAAPTSVLVFLVYVAWLSPVRFDLELYFLVLLQCFFSFPMLESILESVGFVEILARNKWANHGVLLL